MPVEMTLAVHLVVAKLPAKKKVKKEAQNIIEIPKENERSRHLMLGVMGVEKSR